MTRKQTKQGLLDLETATKKWASRQLCSRSFGFRQGYRKVELDIIASNSCSMIGRDQLQQMNRDLADFEKTLDEDPFPYPQVTVRGMVGLTPYQPSLRDR